MYQGIKTVSFEEAVKVVKSGDRIHIHSVACAPQGLIQALCNRGRAGELRDVKLQHLHTEGSAPYAEAEFEGFLLAEIMLTETLTTATRFDCQYIRNIHKLALKELYTFAGRYRTVNMSKGGFLFPSALFIPQSMQFFEDEILKKLPDTYPDKASLAKDVAIVHGELLFIHPFREGNGRTARILANLMVHKQGYEGLRFDKIHFRDYVVAVQRVSEKNYLPMQRIIETIF